MYILLYMNLRVKHAYGYGGLTTTFMIIARQRGSLTIIVIIYNNNMITVTNININNTTCVYMCACVNPYTYSLKF